MNILDLVLNVPLILLMIFLFLTWRCTIIVKQATTKLVLRFGAYHRTLAPGFHVIVPFMDKIDMTVDMQENYVLMDKQQVITKDNAVVNVDAVVFWQIVVSHQYAYDLGGGVTVGSSSSLKPGSREYFDTRDSMTLQVLAATNLRAVIGSMELDEVLSHRDQINERLVRSMSEAVRPWGIRIPRVELKDVLPDPAMVEILDQQMKAERTRRAVVLTAEGTKQAAILQAEGQRQAAFLLAEARERGAQAEAMATSLMSDAIKTGDALSVNYFVAQEYLKALTALASAPNEKVLIMPTEITGVLGSLAGIGEIAKRAFESPKQPPRLQAAE